VCTDRGHLLGMARPLQTGDSLPAGQLRASCLAARTFMAGSTLASGAPGLGWTCRLHSLWQPEGLASHRPAASPYRHHTTVLPLIEEDALDSDHSFGTISRAVMPPGT